MSHKWFIDRSDINSDDLRVTKDMLVYYEKLILGNHFKMKVVKKKKEKKKRGLHGIIINKKHFAKWGCIITLATKV